MIPQRYIQEWKSSAPWQHEAQVEQDLVIARVMIAIFSNDFLKEHLAFRGGTALHKLYLSPQVRYSEDVDLVQIKPGGVGAILDALKETISFFTQQPKVKIKANNNIVIFKFDSEILPVMPMRVKVEINCREHFSVLGFKEYHFTVKNSWFSGSCHIKTFELEELLATKLRALYQRKKGRDLFDLYYALSQKKIDSQKLLSCYREYMKREVSPSSREFILNMEEKMRNSEFIGDIYGLLRPGVEYDNETAYQLVKSTLLEKI